RHQRSGDRVRARAATARRAPGCHRGGRCSGGGGSLKEVQVREVHTTEYEAAGQVTLAAYRHLPGAHMTDSYAAELVAVDRRAGGERRASSRPTGGGGRAARGRPPRLAGAPRGPGAVGPRSRGRDGAARERAPPRAGEVAEGRAARLADPCNVTPRRRQYAAV